MTRRLSWGNSWRKSEAKSWFEEHESHQAAIMSKVPKQAKTRRHQEIIVSKWGESKEKKPQPVKRVEIPKPDGGVRNLGRTI